MHANCSSINVPTVTPNYMAYGELGRNPLFIEAAAKCMQYWFRVLKQPATRHSKMEYQSLLIVSEKDESCVAHIQSLLCRFDYGFVWLFGRSGDERLFLRDFEERLRLYSTQDWFSPFHKVHILKCIIVLKVLLEKKTVWTCSRRISIGLRSHDSDLGCFRLKDTDFVTLSQRQIVLALFAPIKLKTKCA